MNDQFSPEPCDGIQLWVETTRDTSDRKHRPFLPLSFPTNFLKFEWFGKLCFNFWNTFKTVCLMLLLLKSLTWGEEIGKHGERVGGSFYQTSFWIVPCRRRDPLLKNGRRDWHHMPTENLFLEKVSNRRKGSHWAVQIEKIGKCPRQTKALSKDLFENLIIYTCGYHDIEVSVTVSLSESL